MKTYVVGSPLKHIAETLGMSTHNIHFHGEMRKLSCGYPFLSGPMTDRKYVLIGLMINDY